MSGLREYICLNTRPAGQSSSLTRLLTERGASVVEWPLAEVACTLSHEVVVPLLSRSNWLLFTSANAVRCAAPALRELPDACRIAAIGEATAAALRTADLRCDFISARSSGEAFAAEFLVMCERKGQAPSECVCIHLCGEQAGDALQRILTDAGATVTRAVVYSTSVPARSRKRAGSVISKLTTAVASGADVLLLFTSSEIVRHFVELAEGQLRNGLGPLKRHVIAITVGPKTFATAKRYGFRAEVADTPTDESLARAVEQCLKLGMPGLESDNDR